MDQVLDDAYTVTGQLFGPESGIPWWAWVFVLGAIMFKLLVSTPKTAREITDDRDRMILEEMLGGGDGRDGGKKPKKDKKKDKKK